MRKRSFLYALLACSAAFSLGSCSHEMEFDPNQPEQDEAVVSSSFKQGFVILQVSEELAALLEDNMDTQGEVKSIGVKSSDAILTEMGVSTMYRTFPYAGKFEARTRAEGMHLFYNVHFDEQIPLTRAQSDFSKIDGVTAVELRPNVTRDNYQVIDATDDISANRTGGSTFFNDPKLKQQWHYYNDGTYRGKAGCDINVEPVWKDYTVGSGEVIVAIVDGGVELTHEDLQANIWVNEAEYNGEAGVDDDRNGFVDDIHGFDFVDRKEIIGDDHGTHVAGTVSAVNNNEIGVCGVAGGDFANNIPGVRIQSAQVFAGKNSAASFSSAIKYGADAGAVISQNSWGYTDGNGNAISTIYPSDEAAVDYFNKYAGMDENGQQVGPMAGGIVIFAAGNEDSPYGSPAMIEDAIAVTSIGADFQRAYYSNYGDWTDIAAPGGANNDILSTGTKNRYIQMNGTSMACPHVSGVAALIVSRHGGPGFTREQLWDMLLDNANPIIYEGDYNKQYRNLLGRGLVDAMASISSGSKIAPDPVTDLDITTSGANLLLEWTIPADEDDQIPTFFNVYYSEQSFGTDLDRSSLPSGVSTIRLTNTTAAGEAYSHILAGLKENTTYYVAVDAQDNSKNKSELKEVVSASTSSNRAPVIDNEDISLVIRYADVVKETITFADPDLDAVTWTLEKDTPALMAKEDEPGKVTLTFTGMNDAAGDYEARFIVTDAHGATASLQITFSIETNQAPVLKGQIPAVVLTNTNEEYSFDATPYIYDADGEVLNYSFAMNPTGIVRVNNEDNKIIVYSLKYGNTKVSVTARDKAGDQVKTEFDVVVLNPEETVSCYPNPVTEGKLYIRTSSVENKDVEVVLSNGNGATVHEANYQISAINPALIDMSEMAAGSYIVTMTFEGNTYTEYIVKL